MGGKITIDLKEVH